jgi:hypothetical protein
MPDYLNERERAMEDDYFRKKDQELIERMREATALERRTAEFVARVGLSDPALLEDLKDLGFTPDTVAILPLVPIVEMAWAEGGITAAERAMLIALARQRGLLEGSPADLLLASWMDNRPSPDTFARATRLIRAVLDTGVAPIGSMTADEIIQHSESIAAASGGIFGFGKISSEERATLDKTVKALKSKA